MKILAFDTSNGSTSVAISKGQDILAYVEDINLSSQAERLVPMIEETLKYAKLSYAELDYLSVINGPGSFTGIRIGLASAKAIMLATKVIGCAITSFEISHYRARMQVRDYDKIVIFLNAYRDQLYVQTFNNDGTMYSIPALINIEDAGNILSELKGRIICAGSGATFIYDRIKFHANVMILPRFSRVKAYHICRYVDQAIQDQILLNPVEPLYIRSPDAKIKSKLL